MVLFEQWVGLVFIDLVGVQVIVVLGSGFNCNVMEYGSDIVIDCILICLCYGVMVVCWYQLLVLVSGGLLYEVSCIEVEVIVEILEWEFGVVVCWCEMQL